MPIFSTYAFAAGTIEYEIKDDIATLYSVKYSRSLSADGQPTGSYLNLTVDAYYNFPSDKLGHQRLSPSFFTRVSTNEGQERMNWAYVTVDNQGGRIDFKGGVGLDPEMLEAGEINVTIYYGFLAYDGFNGYGSSEASKFYIAQPYTFQVNLTTQPSGTINVNHDSTDPSDPETGGSEDEVDSGKCGENLTWTLDANGTLTISGTGAMYNYQYGNGTPWYEYDTLIESVIIEDGVTAIGNSAFDEMTIPKISIGHSVSNIGSSAFYIGSGNVMVIEFSGNAPAISLEAFNTCGNGLIDIYYDPATGGWENAIRQEYVLMNDPIISWIYSDNATDKLPVSDRLSFTNAEKYFGDQENGYFITQADYDRLTSNLKWFERMALPSLNIEGTEWFPSEWDGSCRGMSVLVALGRLGIIDPSDVQSSAQTMFDVEQGNAPISQSTQSEINFYHSQQHIPAIRSVRSEFMKQSQNTQISQMEQCITAAEQQGKTALIDFAYYSDSRDSVLGHTVLGYAIERGTFKLSINGTEYQFDRRVLIYDPNMAGDQQVASKSALYYNDTQWAMMGNYNVVSTSNDLKTNSADDTAQLQIVTSNPDYINAIDYKTGERNFTEDVKSAFLSGLADFFILENPYAKYNISKGRFNGNNTICDGMVILEDLDAASDTEEETIIALPLDSAYTVATAEQAVDVSLAYENLYLSANSEAPGEVTFNPEGKIDMKTEKSANGSLSLTANDGYTTVPWNVVTAQAADVTELSLSQTDEGIVLEGNDLTNTTVYGTNDKETVELNFSTEEKEVLVTEDEENNTIEVKLDQDDDGTFETTLNESDSSDDGSSSSGDNAGSSDDDSGSSDGNTDSSGDDSEPSGNDTDSSDNDHGSAGNDSGSSSNTGGHSPSRYTVSVASGIDNGSIRVSPSRAERGDTVTITVDPDEGYELDTLTVTDSNGNRITTEKESDTQYTFEMPRGRVSIDAAFIAIEEETAPQPSGEPFTDVSSRDWFYGAVEYVYKHGMMNGTTSNLFAPGGTATRAMIVTILHRLENEPPAIASGFTDIAADSYYAGAVNWAAANGIVNGVNETSFAPNEPITREQLAAILYRYAELKNYDVTISDISLHEYMDADEISAFANTAMQWANENELITGKTAVSLNPQGNATRAEVATILMRFCECIINR